MPTPKELRREADLAEEKARRLLEVAGASALKLQEYAAALRAAADKGESTQGLQTRNGYGTVRDMDATPSVTTAKHPGPKAKNGPMAKLATALGLVSLQAVATALGETYENVRIINSRGVVPARIQKKADALLGAHAERSKK